MQTTGLILTFFKSKDFSYPQKIKILFDSYKDVRVDEEFLAQFTEGYSSRILYLDFRGMIKTALIDPETKNQFMNVAPDLEAENIFPRSLYQAEPDGPDPFFNNISVGFEQLKLISRLEIFWRSTIRTSRNSGVILK